MNIIQSRPNQKFRIIKLKLKDGTWLNLPKTYDTGISQAIEPYENEISGVFTSTATWLNPLDLSFSFKPKPMLLNSDLVIDIDDEDCEDSFDEVKGIYEELKIYSKLKFHKALRSGGGYHLIYEVNQPKIPHPKERLRWHKKFKRTICKTLLRKGYHIDYPVCVDIYRVTRMEGSPHPSGEVCREITLTGTMQPTTANETISSVRNKAGKPTPSKASSIIFAKSVTNQVTWLKDCYIPAIEVDKSELHIIKEIQNIYNLGSFQILTDPLHQEKYTALCFKIVSRERMLKILRYASMRTKRQSQLLTFQKYKQLWITLATKDGDKTTRAETVHFINSNCVDGYFSQSHQTLFTKTKHSNNPTRLKGKLQIYAVDHERKNQ